MLSGAHTHPSIYPDFYLPNGQNDLPFIPELFPFYKTISFMTLVRGFSGFGKCFEHHRWKFKKSKEQEINDGNDYNDAHRAPPSMMVHHGEDVLAQNSDCAPQRLSDKQPLCKAVSWTVEFLVEFDKYYQRQIQISTDGETSRLASLRQATSLQGSDSGKCTNVQM